MAGVFGDGRDVSYPTFLSWATPGPDGLAASGGAHLQPGAAALSALEGEGSGGGRRGENGWNGKRQQQYGGAVGGQGAGERHPKAAREEEAEEEAELKVRTALQRMGEDGISRAWEEFERMDPGGKRGGVREEELVEVG